MSEFYVVVDCGSYDVIITSFCTKMSAKRALKMIRHLSPHVNIQITKTPRTLGINFIMDEVPINIHPPTD